MSWFSKIPGVNQLKYGNVGIGNVDIAWGKKFTPTGGVSVKSPELDVKQKAPLVPLDISSLVIVGGIGALLYFYVLK